MNYFYIIYNKLSLIRSSEHVLPPFMNVKWIKSRNTASYSKATGKFLRLYREKYFNVKRRLKK